MAKNESEVTTFVKRKYKRNNRKNWEDSSTSVKETKETKEELLAIADELEIKYHASVNAQFIREAAELYEKRDRLRKD